MTTTQHQSAWDKILKNENNMTFTSDKRTLMEFYHAKQHRPPQPSNRSKKLTKLAAAGLGLIQKHSFIRSQVPIDKYIPRKW